MDTISGDYGQFAMGKDDLCADKLDDAKVIFDSFGFEGEDFFNPGVGDNDATMAAIRGQVPDNGQIKGKLKEKIVDTLCRTKYSRGMTIGEFARLDYIRFNMAAKKGRKSVWKEYKLDGGESDESIVQFRNPSDISTPLCKELGSKWHNYVHVKYEDGNKRGGAVWIGIYYYHNVKRTSRAAGLSRRIGPSKAYLLWYPTANSFFLRLDHTAGIAKEKDGSENFISGLFASLLSVLGGNEIYEVRNVGHNPHEMAKFSLNKDAVGISGALDANPLNHGKVQASAVADIDGISPQERALQTAKRQRTEKKEAEREVQAKIGSGGGGDVHKIVSEDAGHDELISTAVDTVFGVDVIEGEGVKSGEEPKIQPAKMPSVPCITFHIESDFVPGVPVNMVVRFDGPNVLQGIQDMIKHEILPQNPPTFLSELAARGHTSVDLKQTR